MENDENRGISDIFFKLSRPIFRVIPSYLVFGKLSGYVLGKLKVFMKKYFLTPVGRFLVKNRVIFVEFSTFADYWILTKIRPPRLKIALTFCSDGVGRATTY